MLIRCVKWTLNNTTYNSGDTKNLVIGDYSVTFNTISSYNTPANMNVTILDGESKIVTATYTEQIGSTPTGSLTVSISPDTAVTAGAKWSMDNGETWNESSSVISTLSPGGFTIVYSPINGWSMPDNQSVTVTEDQITSITGTYVQEVNQDNNGSTSDDSTSDDAISENNNVNEDDTLEDDINDSDDENDNTKSSSGCFIKAMEPRKNKFTYII